MSHDVEASVIKDASESDPPSVEAAARAVQRGRCVSEVRSRGLEDIRPLKEWRESNSW